MPQGSDTEQIKWFRSKGKGPSLVDVSNDVVELKIVVKELTNKIIKLEERLEQLK